MDHCRNCGVSLGPCTSGKCPGDCPPQNCVVKLVNTSYISRRQLLCSVVVSLVDARDTCTRRCPGIRCRGTTRIGILDKSCSKCFCSCVDCFSPQLGETPFCSSHEELINPLYKWWYFKMKPRGMHKEIFNTILRLANLSQLK